MALTLTAPQKAKLYSPLQRCDCRFVSFTVYKQKAITSFTPGAYTFLDMLNIYPRHSWVDNSVAITLYGDKSLRKAGGPAPVGHAWTLESGGGGIVANADEVTYTAPGAGTGEAVIKLVTDGNAVGSFARVAYGALGLNVGHVTSFHADIDSGGWEMVVRAYGSCTGLERGKGILLVANDYWNGAEDTFGGYRWSDGVFYGYVDRIKRFHQDAEVSYMEVSLISPIGMLNLSEVSDLYFSQADTGVEIVVGTLKVDDPIWYILHESEFNQRHNCYFHLDANNIANLKLSRGPIGEVIRDVAARTFSNIFSTRVGDLWVIPDPDVRAGDSYWAGDFGDALRFTLENLNVEAWDIQREDVDDPEGVPSPDDPTIGEVVMTAIKSDLTEITGTWPAAHPGYGKRVEIGGLITEAQGDVDEWAEAYWWKLQPQLRATVRMFLMHHVDLYMFLGWNYALVGLSGTEYTGPDNNVYVTNIDFDIDPGLGIWRGGVAVVSQSKASGV